MKRTVTSVAAMFMLATMPVSVLAAQPTTLQVQMVTSATEVANQNINSGTINWKNPFYKGENSQAKNEHSTFQTRSIESAYSFDELKQKTDQYLHNREQAFTVHYQGDKKNFQENIINMMRDIFSDHYLYYSTKSIYISWEENPDEGYVEIAFQADYWQTKQQDEFVNTKVNEILASIIKPGMDEHEKEKAIHDYIVGHVAYDDETNEELIEHSAYAALAKGKTVCQGYATLTYKMLKQAGIENKIVFGSYNNILHTWNIAKIDGKWYHLDTTWDDPIPDKPGQVDYMYYNLTEDEITRDHNIVTESEEYNWIEREYPLADTVYYDEIVGKIANTPDQALRYKRLLASLGFNVSDIKAFREWPAQTGIEPMKHWTIRFNKPVNPDTVNIDTIRVLDENDDYVQTEVTVSEDSIIVAPPEEGYTPGKTYSLIISEEIESNQGKKIKDPIRMKFTIKS